MQHAQGWILDTRAWRASRAAPPNTHKRSQLTQTLCGHHKEMQSAPKPSQRAVHCIQHLIKTATHRLIQGTCACKNTSNIESCAARHRAQNAASNGQPGNRVRIHWTWRHLRHCAAAGALSAP